MLRRVTIAGLLVAASSAWGLSAISVFKTFTAEILTVADLNSSFSRLLDEGINPLIALHPGDSTMTAVGVFDSLDAKTSGNNIGVKRSLVFRDDADSLVVGGRSKLDTVYSDTIRVINFEVTGNAILPGVGSAASIRDTMGLVLTDSLGSKDRSFDDGVTLTINGIADIDTARVDCLTVSGPSTFEGAIVQPAGQQTDLEYATIDTLSTDSLTVIGPATVSGTLTAGALAGDGSAITGLPTGTTISTKITYPDCTKTTYSARKVICGSDYNPYWMHNLDLFRAEQADNSYVASDGYWPDEWCVTISEGQDTVAVWDRRTMGAPWQVYKIAGTNNDNRAAVGDAVGSVWRLDGKLYMGQPGGWGLTIADYRSDVIDVVYTTTIQRFKDDIAGRNNGVGIYAVTNIGTIDDDINAVSAIRDPFGLKDGDWPAQWWGVSVQSGDLSLYNPHANAIYDEAGGNVGLGGMVFLPGGSLFSSISTTQDAVTWYRSALDQTADSFNQDELWINSGSGSEDIAWPNAAVFSDLAAIEHGNIENAPYALLASDHGLYGLQTKPSDNDAGIKVRFHDDYQGPAEVGNAVFAGPMDGNWIDVSPYGNDLTAVGSPGTVQGVFSSAYSTVGTSHLKREADSDFNDPVSMSLWFKSNGTGNPSAISYLATLRDDGGANDDNLGIYVSTDGYLGANLLAGGSSDNPAGTVDVADGEWHHAAAVVRWGSSFDLYLDGELHAQDASLAVSEGAVNTDTLYVGCRYIAGACQSGSYWPGYIDEVMISKTEMTAETVRDIYRAGVAAMNAPLSDFSLPDSNVVAVATIPGGGRWVATADTDSVKVWAKVGPHLIPHSVYPAPGAKIRDVAIWAMADSFGLAIADSTAFQVIQPDPVVTDLAQHRRYPFVQPWVGPTVNVDSAGVEGLFWEIDDAIDAGANANRRHVLIQPGTYPPFTVDHPSMRIQGVQPYQSEPASSGGPGVLVTNENETGSHSCYVTARRVTLQDMTCMTPSGGDGGGKTPLISSSGGTFGTYTNIWIPRSDDQCIYMNGPSSFLHGIQANNCDSYGIRIDDSGDDTIMTDITINTSGDDGIWIVPNAENTVRGNMRISNWTNECVDDDSGTSSTDAAVDCS